MSTFAPSDPRPTPERRAELLAASPAHALTKLAERVIEGRPAPRIVLGPQTGMAMLQVREPVEGQRFYLAEVLVTRAEVEVGGHPGWAMRMGDDRVATLAAAILDAVAEGGGVPADAVARLCLETQRTQAAARQAEWAELASTAVRFEELDR